VIAPANTGKVVNKRKAVTPNDQIIKGRRSILTTFVVREQIIVVMKLILPRIEEIPAICKLKMAKSTEIPEWNLESERGG
jgi:hypothetical protein